MGGATTLSQAAQRLIPLEQGKLDNLCGLYAILNAVRLASWPVLEHRHFTSRRLFHEGIAFLDQEGLLAETLRTGMAERTWRKLCRAVIAEANRMGDEELGHMPLLAKPGGADLATVIAELQHHTEQSRPVLIALHGGYNHYTVIVEVRDHRLILFDSFGYHWVSLDACELDRGRRRKHGKRHRLSHRGAMVICRPP